MRKICFFFISIFLCAGFACATGRTQISATKKEAGNTSTRQAITQKNNNISRATTNRNQTNPNIQKSTASTKKTTARTTINKNVSPRLKSQTTPSRSAVTSRHISRMATSNVSTNSFGETYNSCRDAYFTCMDQFCANQNETYRRCVCSSRLTEIQSQEKRLAQTADSLQDFQNLNIEVISKTSDEVKAMLSASEGEKNIKKDTSLTSKTLSNISEILQKSKKNSLSTQGTIDIAGNIKNIWTTTNFIAGSDLANLTGESLYNSVHTQCKEIVSELCTESDLKMVSSAYGMYIENDCSVLANNLDSKTTTANTAIRTTRHQMQDTRLENYNAHNSLSVNECIARVRQDIISSKACGENYLFCLDFSGKYLNLTTGKPIYSPDFYQLENQLSLSGDTLKSEKNSQFVNMLNKKRSFAQQSLDLCVDDADVVWDEFLRQAIVEIYQQQQQRVQDVKSECLKVVNECYLNKSDTLQDFSDNSSLISLGHTLELSEDLCVDKLNTCSNLYGGGPEGLSVLVSTMHNITDQTIAQTCPELLTTFAQKICAVSVNDSTHSYPYGCRVHAPGEAMYAHNAICNQTLVNPFSRSDVLISEHIIPDTDYICSIGEKRYIQCKFNYYLYHAGLTDNNDIETKCGNHLPGNNNGLSHLAYYNSTHSYCMNDATECRTCPYGYICSGGISAPESMDQDLYTACGVYYIGSLYQQLVRYAVQNCTRPSDASYTLSESLLADVDTIVRTIKTDLAAELASECAAYDGTWVDIPWQDDNFDGYHDITGDSLLLRFYEVTGTNKLWGYCK